ncbi:MAG: PilZ domain-containing protein [Devosia sp.]|uniref:PilZ domain-containing protein n=1 Tax=Devosia sp. TaxID=1871048 RepID=UPI0024C664A7|nr:PilZ domain-containing protein [Devosia sp.]UYO00292.1 MAG: PilZ domain-containing protein [Devosia sp.]
MVEAAQRISASLEGISTVAGRYVIGDQAMHPGLNLFACRLRSISPDRLTVTAPVIPGETEAVTLTFGPFGTLRGTVERLLEDGFAVTLEHEDDGESGLAAAIDGFRDRIWPGVRERRQDHRFMPGNPRSVIARPDGWAQPCLVVDYSVSGAAVSAAFQPAVGEIVTVGQITSEVVRLFDVGFAVRFFERQDPDEIESLLEAPEEWLEMRRAARAPDPDALLHEAYGGDG